MKFKDLEVGTHFMDEDGNIFIKTHTHALDTYYHNEQFANALCIHCVYTDIEIFTDFYYKMCVGHPEENVTPI